MALPTHLDDLGLKEVHYNPLQNYRNVTYNARLTMMPKIEATQERLQRSYDYKKGYVVWETGATGSIYLEEMTIETVGTGSSSGNYAMQQFHKFAGKLVEPVGGKFMEALSIGAMNFGYPNNSDAIYLLEVFFSGHNTETDMPEQCKGWDGEELIFRWYTRLLTLKMKLDFKGSTYDFEMTPYGASSQTSDHTHLEQGFKMDGAPKNIGQFCKDLETALNEREAEKVKSKMRCYPHVYKIIPHKDIANLEFSDKSWFGKLLPDWGILRGSIQVPAGTTIQQFILASMPNSKAILSYLHKVEDGKKKLNEPDTLPDTIHMLPRSFSMISGAKAIESNGNILFDDKIGTSVKEVTYFLTTKEDAKNIIGAQEFKDAWDPVQRAKRVDVYLKYGLLRKAYKWIYTGENTEVINCEIKLDNLWRLVRPMWIGKDGKPTAPAATGQPATKKKELTEQQKIQAIPCNAAREVKIPVDMRNQSYLEDLVQRPGDGIGPKKDWYPHMPQIHHANSSIAGSKPEGALSPELQHEYSVYRQIGNSLSNGNADLLTINLEVVGDPYFLFQIPGTPGKAPYEEDVYEYIAKNLTEEQMAETRKKTASHNWLPFIFFQAQIPAADTNGDDLMNLRQADSITGIYSARKVINKFVKGKFTTTLDCYRDQLSNPWNGKSTASSDTVASPTQTGSANRTGPANAAAPVPADGGGGGYTGDHY